MAHISELSNEKLAGLTEVAIDIDRELLEAANHTTGAKGISLTTNYMHAQNNILHLKQPVADGRLDTSGYDSRFSFTACYKNQVKTIVSGN